jgi:hypothetical protein
MANPVIKAKHLSFNDDAPVAGASLIGSVDDPTASASLPSDLTVPTLPDTPPRPRPAPSGNWSQMSESQPVAVVAVSSVPSPEPEAGVMLNGVNQAVNAASSGLVFQNNFGLDGSFNTLTSSEQAAFEVDARQAEADLSGQFVNSLTANVDFEVVSDSQDGFNAANQASADELVSFTSYVNALHSVATSNYQLNAVAAIKNLTDLGQNPEVELPAAYARMLGLSNSGTRLTNSTVQLGSTQFALSTSVDDTVFLNTALLGATLADQSVNTPDDGIVGVIEHELTENVMGRIGQLGQVSPNQWGPTDFFRVNSAEQSYLTPDNSGSAGTSVYFSPAPGVTAPVSSLQFNNVPSNGDFADWISGYPNPNGSDPSASDPFGPGGFLNPSSPSSLSISSVLSPTDIDLMNVLGWTLSSGGGSAPPLTIALENDTGASPTANLTSNSTLTGLAASDATVTLTENGTSLGPATADTGGGWTFTPVLADGQYTVTASESYGTGQTVTAAITFTLATKAPTISASESVSGETSQTSDTITVSATAENVGANAIAGVEIFDGTSNLGVATLSNGSWTFTVQNLLPGAHDFTAKATDTAGNTAAFALPQVTVSGSQAVSHYTLSDFSFTGDGVTDIRPKGINDSGEIVGYYIDARPDDIGADGQTYYEHGFYSTLSNSGRQYFTIDNPDAPLDSAIGEPSSPDRTRAFAVNNNGDIVGWYSEDQTAIADNGAQYVLPDAGYIMSVNWPGTFGTLGFTAVGGYGTHALGINSTDQIVGYYVDALGEEHGFLRGFTGYGDRGNYVSLDPTGSINTVAEGINDSGEVVGFYETSDLVFHGFSYSTATGVFSPIDVNGATGTEALGVNNSGEIVGEYFDSAGNRHGFVRSSTGQLTTIDDANAGSGGTLVGGINDENEIVGWYTAADGHDQGFVGVAPAMPQIAGTVANQGVANDSTIAPFATVTITDPNVGATDSVTITLSDPQFGALSNLGGGTYNSTTGVYTVSGAPAAVTTAIDGLVLTPVAPAANVYVTSTTLTVGLVGPGGGPAASTMIAASVQQILGLATVPSGQLAISVTADGTGLAAPVSGETNEAVITSPTVGGTYTLPTGYQSEFLGGTANATLQDTGVGGAVLVGNAGNDLLSTFAARDTIQAGSGATAVTLGGSFGRARGGTGNFIVDDPTANGTVIGGTADTMFVTVGAAASHGDVFGRAGNTNIIDLGADALMGAGGGTSVVSIGGAGTQLYGASPPGGTLNVNIGAANALVFGLGDNTTVDASSAAATSALVYGGFSSIAADDGSLLVQTGADSLVAVTGGSNATINAGTGGLYTFIGTGSLAGSNVINGASASQLYTAFIGGAGSATVYGGEAGASVFGVDGTDATYVNNLAGAPGAYLVANGSRAGGETLNAAGSATNDSLFAAQGNVSLMAGSGNDLLTAGANTGLVGGAGTVVGGDTMMAGMAGSGADLMLFTHGTFTGGAVVINFSSADTIFLSGYNAAAGGNQANMALANATVAGGNTTIALTDGSSITFVDATTMQLQGHLLSS